MEVVKEDIIDRKAGKGVKEGAEHRPVPVPDKPPQVPVGGDGGAGGFQNQQRGHQVGDEGGGKGKGEPEERGKEEIEAVGTDEIGPQVGLPAPPDVPLPHRLVGQLVKGNLLDIKVPVKEEIALIVDDIGEKGGGRHKQPQKKNLERPPPPGPQTVFHRMHLAVRNCFTSRFGPGGGSRYGLLYSVKDAASLFQHRVIIARMKQKLQR